MTETIPEPVWLERHDWARNMARFYVLALQPTLFGDFSLVRNWGRIGTQGQVKMQSFSDAGTALAAAMNLERVKRRRGYRRVVSISNPRYRRLEDLRPSPVPR